MFELSRRTHSIQIMDACPSELIHTFSDKVLVQSLINYYDFDFTRIEVAQYKATRKDRKLAAQQRIIDAFEAGYIRGCGVITQNSQLYAMDNARKFAVDAGYIKSGLVDLAHEIEVAGQVVSVGVFLSLVWYAIGLAGNFRTAAIFANVEKKDKVFIVLDFLPGDSVERYRRLSIIKELTRHTLLNDIFHDAVQNYKVSLGYGYAGDPETGNALKTALPMCVSDWITHSFYAKIRRENIIPDDKHQELEPYTALADYLTSKGFLRSKQLFDLKTLFDCFCCRFYYNSTPFFMKPLGEEDLIIN